MQLVTTDLAHYYAMQMINLKHILLHKCWHLIFFIISEQQSGRAINEELEPKSGPTLLSRH